MAVATPVAQAQATAVATAVPVNEGQIPVAQATVLPDEPSKLYPSV